MKEERNERNDKKEGRKQRTQVPFMTLHFFPSIETFFQKEKGGGGMKG
jgi:hypothetical protein